MIDDTDDWPRWPETDQRSQQAVAAALLGGRLTVSGARSHWLSRNQAAADALARKSGRRHAVLTPSGSSAIVVALQALGIGPGDRVALTASTWVACATTVLRVGATPLFFDADATSPCGSVDDLATHPDAILAIHLYAQQFDVERARTRFPGVPVIEDLSHSQFGVHADGRPLGTLGDLAVLSLQATKTITSGEGGAVLTDDPDMAARLESLVNDSRRRVPHPADTAVNELEPAHLLHGANHALPEMSAALLLDQLDRYEEQAQRRTRGAELFLDRLDGTTWQAAADPITLASGAFYGMALRIPEGSGTPEEVITRVQRRTGLVLDRVYPPVPEGPLYRPKTVKRYARAMPHPPATPNSRRWHESCVVVPHHAFLARPEQLERLAAAVRGEPARSPEARPGTRRPVIDVVVITRGDRLPLLQSALTSIALQDVEATVRTTLWVDGPALPSQPDAPFPLHAVVNLDSWNTLPEHPFVRIAALRDLAVRRCTGDYVAFLDDDNTWEEDHLSSLLSLALDGCPAVHSWRLLVGPDGRPTPVDRFPWLPDREAAVTRLRALSEVGVMDPDSPVVRDGVDLRVADGSGGMVDMGEWLFDRRLLDLLDFRRDRTDRELADRVGEDDLILEQMARLGVPVRCTRKPTLRYRLGGMSSPEFAVAGP